MVRIKGTEFSGAISTGKEDEISVVICTPWAIEDILPFTKDVKEVVDIRKDGIETVYIVTRPIAVSYVSPNVYSVRFSTKKTETQVLEEKNQELSDAIDDILVMMLEG